MGTQERLLTTLDVLLLSFVRFGLTTAYDLMSQAGMSVGLTGQALQRLEKLGMLTAAATGARNRKSYTVTAKGEEELRAALDPAHQESNAWFARFGVFDAAPRAIFLGWLYAKDEIAWTYVHWSIMELQERSRLKSLEAERQLRAISRLASAVPEGNFPDKGALVAKVYWLMKAVSDAALLKAQVEVLEKVFPILSEMPTATQPRAEFLKSIRALAKNLDFQLDEVTTSIRRRGPEDPISQTPVPNDKKGRPSKETALDKIRRPRAPVYP